MHPREYRSPENGFSSLPFKPPFCFTGVVTRVFPLRANPHVLQSFVDGYLNVIPPELGRFKAFIPYVYLMVLDYGRMASAASNLGWISQHEVMFSVPLEWYRVVDGQWVFHDWAWISPFIFVDESLSQSLGRMVYGWPKVLAKFDNQSSTWSSAPTDSDLILGVNTQVFRKLYAGAKQESNILLGIRREQTSPLQQVPPNLKSPFSPWMVGPNMAQSLVNASWDAFKFYAAGGTAPPAAADRVNNLSLMADAVARMFSPVGADLHFNTVNLKQFRSSSDPNRYCYQAVTNTRMSVASFNGGGVLAGEGLMGADPSGGYKVKLHCWPSLPIIETLGLDVEERVSSGDVDIATLRPVMPFWYDVDMNYNVGYNVAWRSFDTQWRDEWGRRYPRAHTPPTPGDRQFNSTLGPSAAPVAGAFFYDGVTVRVLPVKATLATLQNFLDELLNEPLKGNPDGFDFKVWTGDDASDVAMVLLTAISCKEKMPEMNNVGSWSESELTFMVPVVVTWWDRSGPSSPQRRSVQGLVPTFTFNNSALSSVISSEVAGIPTTASYFNLPPQKWMSYRGPSPETTEPFVQVLSDQMPVFGANQQASQRCVVEIGGSIGEASPHGFHARRQSAPPPSDYEYKHSEHLRLARDQSIDVIGGLRHFTLFTLKQLRDVAVPDDACFQSLVAISRTFHPEFAFGELPQPLHVRIHELPSAPIVHQLGLLYDSIDREDGACVYTLRPEHAFWLSTSAIELTGDALCFRAGDGDWERGPDLQNFLDALTQHARPATTTAGSHGGLRGLSTIWRARAASADARPPVGFARDGGPDISTVPPFLALRAAVTLQLTGPADVQLWRRTLSDLQKTLDHTPDLMAQLDAVRALIGRWGSASPPDVVTRDFDVFRRLTNFVVAAGGPGVPAPRVVEALSALFADAPPPRVSWLRSGVFLALMRLGLNVGSSWADVLGALTTHPSGPTVMSDVIDLLRGDLPPARNALIDLLARPWPHGIARRS